MPTKTKPKDKPPAWRAVIYLTEEQKAAIEARAGKDGIRTPTLWIASQVRKVLAS